MWVVSKDSEKTVNCYSFSVQKDCAKKGFKYAIVGEFAHSMWGGSFVSLAYYKTKEEAIKDLEKLNKSLTKGEKLFKF